MLDQYGIKHLEKINNFLQKGTDVLIFVSSGHIRRFCEDANFEKYIKIPKEIFIKKPFYETHRTIVKYLRELFPKAYISPFTLIKDNENINGLIFFSAHRKGQEQFLKTAWKIDKDFGEGNINIDKDISREKGTLFYNENIPTQKEEEYKSLLLEFLREKRNNIEIRNFGLDNGFLVKHTNVILKEIKNKLKCEYYGANFGFHLDKKEIKVYIWLKK